MREIPLSAPACADRRSPDAALARALVTLIDERCERFVRSPASALFDDSDAFLTLPDALLDALRRRAAACRALVAGWRAAARRDPERHPLIARLCDHTRRFIKNNHQFLILTPAQQRALAGIYLDWLAALAAALEAAEREPPGPALRAMLAAHRDRLRAFVAGLGLRAGGPICREYPPELQLRLLGLAPADLDGPLLDLGCGETAGLVRALRRRGVAAVGLDAFAPQETPGLIRGDWLTVPLGRDRWRTIVSHMAFSHHFLHHHLAEGEGHIRYARRYMDILAALEPGGSFCYTPGLPFIEEVLPPERYRVERRAIAAEQLPFEREITARLGTSTFYRARVRRLG